MRRFFFLLVLLPSLAHAEVSTYLSRYNISLQDTVRLTIEVTQPGQAQRPDLSTLTQDFQLLGSKKMTISSLQGKTRVATTRWQVLIRPKRSGTLTIPAFTIQNDRSLPITVNVSGPSGIPSYTATQTQAPSGILPTTPLQDTSRPLFIENELDYTEAYESSQLIYSVRLYHKEPLSKNVGLTDPFLNRALIVPLGDAQEEETLYQGQRYFVKEQRYAIFADEPGTYDIEPPLFSGTTVSGNPLETVGSELEVAIIPRANTNSQGYWLPANDMLLTETLEAPDKVEPGVAIIRKLSLTATGLPAARLPSLAVLQNELATIELLDVTLSETISEQGLVGTRTETLRITPKERGEITLPPIDIHWWDTYEDRAKIASRPPVIIRVDAKSANSLNSSTHKAQLATTISAETTAPEPQEASDVLTKRNTSDGYIAVIVFLLTLSTATSLGWLYTYNKLRHFKRHQIKKRSIVSERQKQKRERTYLLAENNTFQALTMACQQNNAEFAKLRLIEWAQHFWPDSDIASCEDISAAASNQTLDFLIIDLEQHIYNGEAALWQGDLLLQAVDTLRQRRLKSTHS